MSIFARSGLTRSVTALTSAAAITVGVFAAAPAASAKDFDRNSAEVIAQIEARELLRLFAQTLHLLLLHGVEVPFAVLLEQLPQLEIVRIRGEQRIGRHPQNLSQRDAVDTRPA